MASADLACDLRQCDRGDQPLGRRLNGFQAQRCNPDAIRYTRPHLLRAGPYYDQLPVPAGYSLSLNGHAGAKWRHHQDLLIAGRVVQRCPMQSEGILVTTCRGSRLPALRSGTIEPAATKVLQEYVAETERRRGSKTRADLDVVVADNQKPPSTCFWSRDAGLCP